MKYSDIFRNHAGKLSDKWEAYLDFYDRLTDSRTPETILEIGVQNGGSLEIWATKYPSAKSIVGLDIDEKCRDLKFDDKRIKVVVSDSSDPSTLEMITSLSARFDLIVDDGSHRSPDIIKSLVQYLPLVNAGGVYVIEDLHASYWQSWGGGLVEPLSAMSFLKRIADVINAEHWDRKILTSEYLKGFSDLSTEFIDAISNVQELSFENSMCTLKFFAEVGGVGLGSRVTAGSESLVDEGPVTVVGSKLSPELNTATFPSFHPTFFTELAARIPELEEQLARIRELEQKLEVADLLNKDLEDENERLHEVIGEIVASKLWRLTSFLRK
jgi:predicted O-methyltransferase YrrM